MNESVNSILLMAILSVSLFCACSLGFLKAVVTPIPLVNNSVYSKAALRLARGYRIFAWGVLMATFLVFLVMSFAEVYTRL